MRNLVVRGCLWLSLAQERRSRASVSAFALKLWEAYRGMEEYARETFPIEESNNGLTWMNEGDETTPSDGGESDDGSDDDDEDVLTMGRRREEGWLA